jgi:hypothetical protein
MKKLFKWIAIILGILLIILISVPFLFKDKIIAMVKTEANKNLNAKFDFANLDLSLIRNFPNLSIQIEKLSIVNYAPFSGDTLIYAGSLGLTVDIMSVIKGTQIEIKKVSIDDPVMNFLVNRKGLVNWDIAKPSNAPEKASEPSSFKARLQKYSMSNGIIVYDDQTMPFKLRLEGVNHTGSGDFTQDLFTLSTKTEVKKADLIYGGVPYISKAKAEILADLDMDMKNMKFTFKDNKINLNELELGLNGWIAMPDTNIDMDLKYSAAKTDFKNFISMIPAVYSESFKDVKSSGKMAFSGYVKGRFNAVSMPGFGIILNIDNGMFQYPSLPSAVKDVFVDLKVDNPDGVPDHTFINLSKFHMTMNNDPFDARLILSTPVSDPDIDAFMKGKIDLGGIQKLVPLEKGTLLSGIVTADLTMKGRMSAVEQKRYSDFNASGNFGITGMKYSSADSKQPVIINTMQLAFNPQVVSLSDFSSTVGKSDFAARGTLDNFLAYALKDELLRGNLSLMSKTIDLNEFMGGESTDAKQDTTQMSVIDVPANIDFTFTASIGTLIYQNLNITNAKGKIIVRDKTIRMDEVFMQMLDGSMTLSGGYSSADIKKPNFDFTINAKDFDIQKTVTSFESVAKMAPIAKNCTGKFSVSMSARSDLDGKMSPIMNTLSGSGKLATGSVVVSNFPAFNKVADALKMESWKKFTIPPVSPSFKFVNGRVFVDPFDMNVNGIKATVAGSNGFDQTIDYTMSTNIPRSAFGSSANSALDNLLKQANSKGVNVSVGETIPVAIKIGGTVTSPTVSTDFNHAGAKMMDDLKAQASAAAEKLKAEAEAKAKAEADKLKKEGEAKLDAEKQKAAAEGDRLKKEAEAKAKAQSDSAKKAAEKKAQDELKKLNPFKK